MLFKVLTKKQPPKLQRRPRIEQVKSGYLLDYKEWLMMKLPMKVRNFAF
jgi:hypothetical protein